MAGDCRASSRGSPVSADGSGGELPASPLLPPAVLVIAVTFGGRYSLALAMWTDEGKIMGSSSWMRGSRRDMTAAAARCGWDPASLGYTVAVQRSLIQVAAGMLQFLDPRTSDVLPT